MIEMEDISMCTHTFCPNDGHCYRVQEKASDWPPIGADLLEESVGAGPEGPELRPVARIYMKGRYRRASVLPGDGEGLVRQSDAEKWRKIAILCSQTIEGLTRERDALAETVRQLTHNA
jgi:hypothetical protein